MDFINVVNKRRSIRRYKSDPVADDLIEKILEYARVAPSAGNRQPCHFIIVKDAEKKKALVKFLDDAIDLPFWAEPFDGLVLDLAIDGIVGYYNAKLGHGWINIIKQFLL